ncbi:MAG: DUF1080 domain-containing protein [Bacteroidales bacterium]
MKHVISSLVLISLLIAGSQMFYSCKSFGKKADTTNAEAMVIDPFNSLTEQEKAEGWIMLFDGKSFDGWRGYGKDSFPAGGWVIDSNALKCNGSGRGEAGSASGGDILYDKKFSNFHIKLEWRISEGGNSGIFYLGQEDSTFDFIWKTAPEMQVLDNAKHPDAQAGKDGNRQAGSLYDLIPAVPQNAKPAGEWNTAEIKVYKGTVWHYQNGVQVLEYHLWTPEWNKMVADSKFPALNPKWAEVAAEGYIGLQDHGDDVWYRNIKIKEL